MFLPKGAIYIDVVPENNEDKHTWAFFMGKDLMPLQVGKQALRVLGRALRVLGWALCVLGLGRWGLLGEQVC